MNQDEKKKLLGIAAAEYIDPMLEIETYIGVGTGSTANFLLMRWRRFNTNLRAL